jgi:hypothetical protein
MTGPFSRSTLWVVTAVAAISLVVAVALTVLGGGPSTQRSAGADAYSRSAIGHRALVELLERLDVPVVVSRNSSADKAKHGLLIIAEPHVDADDAAGLRLRKSLAGASRVLIVLPRWYGFARPGAPWIDRAVQLPTDDVAAVLRALGSDPADVTRRQTPLHWSTGELPSPVLVRPQTIRASGDVEADVADGDDVLLASTVIDGTNVSILADPEVLDNAGLRHPENAQFAIALIDRLRDDGPVVFDETSHGYVRSPSLLRVLFRFPLVLATLQVLICALLAVWAAMVRFGPARAAPPPLAPGKDFLIRNTAALLRFGGHNADALRRYLAGTIHSVRHALHAPDGMSREALVAWLERIRLRRGGTISLPELEHAVEAAPATPQRVVELADLIYRWRMEMTHGSHSGT